MIIQFRFFMLSSLFYLVSQSTFAAPNFILVLTDDHGWSSFSAPMDKTRPEAKSDYYQTPNMDALLNMGMRFSQGYAAAPVCSPTRYSIQFGKTPARLQRTRVIGKNRADHNQIAIPQVLKAIDPSYRAAHIGKWHIDADPERYGYDLHDGNTKNKEAGFDNNDRSRQWGGYAEDDPKRVHSITARAIEFMRDSVDKDQPFFLQLSHYAVHSNIVYSESSYANVGKREKGKLHNNQAYAAMIEDLDNSIGTLLAAYEALGLADNTYIIFTADNGGMPVLPMQLNRGRPYKAGLNSPLLRGKWDLTEGGIRVPFAMVGPGIAANSQTHTPVVSYDLLPTIADLAGSTKNLPKLLDGGSFRELFNDPEAVVQRPFEGLVFHFPHYNTVGMNEPHSALRLGDYKLIDFPTSKRRLLFNIANDIGESTDLSEIEPAVTDKLAQHLTEYLDSVNAEKPQDSSSWSRAGKNGTVKSKFFKRYQRDSH